MQEVTDYARSFLGTPYIWGGNNCLSGFDCSGLVNEVLRSFALVREHEDLTAQLLYDRFSANEVQAPAAGALLFFGAAKNRIVHVTLAVSNRRHIEAGGGDRTTTDFHKAALQGAVVRERMISSRPNCVAIVMPPWP